MDSHLKERLVGAAVLVAAAVILIPEMLSGPAEREAETADVARPAGEGIKTYTIDLGNRARSGAQATVDAPAETIVESKAPPPEEAPAAPLVQSPTVSEKPAEPETREVAPPPAAADRAPPSPAVARPAPEANLPWAVQVGSFASQATAERLKDDLKRRGYPSFVVPFKPGAQTLYRVRIGPMQERSAADAMLQKLKREAAREGTAATVVANT